MNNIILINLLGCSKPSSFFKESFDERMLEKGVWEVIDGQQRLTTIFLLYKYLLDQKGWDAEKLRDGSVSEKDSDSSTSEKGGMIKGASADTARHSFSHTFTEGHEAEQKKGENI